MMEKMTNQLRKLSWNNSGKNYSPKMTGTFSADIEDFTQLRVYGTIVVIFLVL